MADVVKPEVRSRMMSGIRGKDTQPELVLRKGLFHRGVRFRLHSASLPGRPDIVIGRYRVAILVHGCFWHSHQGCRFFRIPENNRDFWEEKLGRNRVRDTRNLAALKAASWRVGVVWECATRAEPERVLDTLIAFIKGHQPFIEISGDMASGTAKESLSLLVSTISQR